MKNPVSTRVLKSSLSDFINQQPVHVQRWILLSGDGMSSSPSWQFTNSWTGMLSDTGKQVFSNYIVPGDGDVTWKNFVVVLPVEVGKADPQRDDQIILYDLAGGSMGKFRVLFSQAYYAGSNQTIANKWKVELHVTRIES